MTDFCSANGCSCSHANNLCDSGCCIGTPATCSNKSECAVGHLVLKVFYWIIGVFFLIVFVACLITLIIVLVKK